MTNINCSESCVYEDNGKCSLTHVGPLSSLSIIGTDCAYFAPKNSNIKRAPLKK